MKMHVRPLLIAALLLYGAAAHAENWPQFRGPTGQGETSETNLPTTWGGKDNRKCALEIAAAADDRQRRGRPQSVEPDCVGRSRLCDDGLLARRQAAQRLRRAACHLLSIVRRQAAMGHDYRARSVEIGRSSRRLCGADADDRRPAALRRVRLGAGFRPSICRARNFGTSDIENYQNIDVCFASSPILFRDTVILLTDKNNNLGRLTAYDAASGAIRWEKKRPTVVYGHTTPLITTINGKPQMLIASSNALQSFNPENGEIDLVGRFGQRCFDARLSQRAGLHG